MVSRAGRAEGVKGKSQQQSGRCREFGTKERNLETVLERPGV